MTEQTNWLVHDHRRYEEALEACEVAAGAGNWDEAVRLFHQFAEDFQLHMRIEDEVLYPMFKETYGDPRGELASLTEEHETIVHLVQDLGYIIRNRDFDHFEESLEPLYRTIADHHEYEEEIFSQMSDDSLLRRRDEAVRRLQAVKDPEGRSIWEL